MIQKSLFFILFTTFNFYSVAAVASLSSGLLQTQEVSDTSMEVVESEEPPSWDFDISPLEPYFWLANTSANATLAGNDLPIEIDFFDNAIDNMGDGLHVKLELHLFAQKNKWTVIFDPTRLKADSSQSFTDNVLDTSSHFKMIDLKVGYEVLPLFDVFFGGRYTSQDLVVSLQQENQSVKGHHKWWNPLVGARYRYNFNRDWNAAAGIYWGGFNRSASDDFTSSGNVMITYDVNDWLDLNLGYRVLKVNIVEGEGPSEFMYDAKFSGFLLGANLSFF